MHTIVPCFKQCNLTTQGIDPTAASTGISRSTTDDWRLTIDDDQGNIVSKISEAKSLTTQGIDPTTDPWCLCGRYSRRSWSHRRHMMAALNLGVFKELRREITLLKAWYDCVQ